MQDELVLDGLNIREEVGFLTAHPVRVRGVEVSEEAGATAYLHILFEKIPDDGIGPCGAGDSYENPKISGIEVLRAGAGVGPFARGDCNDDGKVDISDGICILGWLFLGGEEPGCKAVANTNGDGNTDLSDAVYLLTHLFLGGPPPSEPFPGCGWGLTSADEDAGCAVRPASCP